jgi:hypothetical protein
MDVSVDSFYCPFLNLLRCIMSFPFVIFHVYMLGYTIIADMYCYAGFHSLTICKQLVSI